MLNCDLTSALEDGTIGGVIIAIVWALWSWWHKSRPQKSAYEK